MIKIFVYAVNEERAEEAVQTLKSAGAEHVEPLESLKLSSRQPKENRYLFICETPEEKLTALAPQVLPENDYAKELGAWYAGATATIAAFNSQKRRAILVSDSQLNNLNTFIDLINEQWTLSLKPYPELVAGEPISQGGQLLAYLVQNLVNQTPELLSLSDEISKLLGTERETVHETEALTAYRGLNQNINQLNADKQALLDTEADLKHQLKDSTEEAELLLTQLHTVQEELERIFLEGKSKQEAAEKDKATLTKEKADLTAARDAQAKAAADRQKQVEALTKEKADLTAARDAQAKAAADRQKQVEALTKEKAELAAARDVQAKGAKESTEEAELLLNQLHQVQEELEHYFIKYKEAELQREKQNTRWQNILATYPDYIAFESIKATPKDSDKNTLSWSITGLENTKISRPQLEFETFIEKDFLGFRFKKDSCEKQSGVKVWPEFAKDLNVLELIPVGRGETKALRAKTLKALSGSDWQLTQALPKLIQQAVKDGTIRLNEQQNVAEALQKFTRSIQLIPKVVRYDAVSLKNSQVNVDYEHLWFVFENMCFGDRFWPKFEIRLGAANLVLNGFSTRPKIEIPLIDGTIKPFEGWFEESTDDYGPKLEIRFDLTARIADKNILKAIPQESKELLIKMLFEFSGHILTSDLVKGIHARSISDWILVTNGCIDLLKNEL